VVDFLSAALNFLVLAGLCFMAVVEK